MTITYRACSIIANDDLSTGNLPGSNAVLNILANDKLFDGSTPLPSAVTVDLDPGTAGVQTTLAVPGQGTWSYNTTTGDLTFDPQPGFTGNPTPITYVLTETATGLSDNALVTVLYTELPPTAVDDHSTGNAPGANTIVSILANDKLSDGSQATTGNTTVALIDPATGHPSITPNVVVVPGQGTWSYDPSTGLLTFNPEPGFTGDPTPLTYVLTETQTGLTDPAIVTIGYTKSPPTANDDSSTGNTPGTTVTQNILVNDHLSDGTPASTTNSTVSLINPGTGLPSANPNLVVVPGEGTWTYNPATGELSFTPQAGFTGTPTNISYQLTENANGLTDNATVHVGYDICPTMTAGDDATICETAVPYTITGASAVNYVSVHWTTDGTGTFDDATKVNPKYTPSASDIEDVQVVLTMTVTGTAACPVQTDQMVLTIWKQVTAFAGQDGSSCANTAYHVTDAHATNYTSVAWTISQGTGSLAGANTLAPIYTPGLNETGAVILTLTAQPIGTCPQATDQVTITYLTAPTANAGSDGTTCEEMTYTVSGSSATNSTSVHWTTNGTGILTGETTFTPTYTPAAGELGQVILTLNATGASECPVATDQMILTILPKAMVNAGTDATICENTSYMVSSATAAHYSSLLWTAPGPGVLSGETSLTPTYAPAPGQTGDITLTLTAGGISPCLAAIDGMILHILPAAIAHAGNDATICEGSDYQLTGTSAPNSSGVEWTTSGTGTFSNIHALDPIYTPSPADIGAGTVTLTIHAAGNAPCATASDEMILTIVPAPVADAGQDATICETSTSYVCNAVASNYTSFYWSTTGTGTFTDIHTLNPIYIPSLADQAAGCVYLVLHVSAHAPCEAITDTMKLCISRIPLANAGPDDMICQGFAYQLSGSTALYYGDLTWTTSGTGTFNNNKILHPVYTPSLADFTAGSVILKLNLTANSPCPNTSDEMTLQIHPNPIATASLVNNVKCNGFSDGSVKVTVTSGTPEYTYLWSDGQTTSTATGLAAGTYTVTVTDHFGCKGTSSATVAINPLPVLVITNPAAVCEPNTVNLTDPSVTTGSTLYGAILSYWLDAGATSSMTHPSTAGAGTYYIKATTFPGCYDIKPVTVIVNPLPDAVAGADREICLNTATTLGATAIPGNTYSWTSVPAGFTSSLANPTVTPLITTTYTLVETITLTGCTNTHSVKVTVDPTSVGGAIASDQTICTGTSPANLTLSGNTGSVVKWQKSTDAAFTSPIDIAVTSLTLSGSTIGNLTTNTYFRAIVQSGVCNSVASNYVLITVNPAGQVNQPALLVVCNGSGASVIFETTNNSGTTAYSWTNTTTSIGLGASGTGNISFTATNTGTTAVVATIEVTPTYIYNGVSCIGQSKTFTITVNPSGQVNDIGNQVVCNGSLTTPVSFSTVNSGGNTTYTWTNNVAGIGLAASGTGNIDAFTAINTGTAPVIATITVTPVFEKKSVSCVGISKTFTFTVNPSGQVTAPVSQVVCNGALTTAVIFNTNNTGGTTSYTWTNNTPSIGLAASGSGNILAFSAINTGTAPVMATIVVTPVFTNGSVSCSGLAKSFTITVNPSGQVFKPADQVVCNGALTNAVTFTTNNIVGTTTYTWTNNTTSIGLGASGSGNIPAFSAFNSGSVPVVATVTVTPHFINGAPACDGTPQIFTITVNPTGQVNDPADQVVCDGSLTSGIIFTTSNTVGTTTYTWTNNTTSIGLAASGSGNIAAFTAINTGSVLVVATVTVTPHFTYGSHTCDGPVQTLTITVNPRPLLVTHPQEVCSPNKVDLTAATVTAGSTPGLAFTYWTDAAATIAYPTPTAATTGTYYIKGTIPATGCYTIQPVTVNIHPLPTVFAGTGSGSYCAGGPGLLVGLNGSQIGVNYTLWYGCCTPVGVTVAGTGGPINFGYQTTAGYYSVLAEDATTSCYNWMYNCIIIYINPLPAAYDVTGSGSYCAGATGVVVGLSGSQVGVNYTLVPGGTVVAGTGSGISFGLHTTGTYTVTAKNATTNCINSMNGSAVITMNPLPAALAGSDRLICLNAGTQIGAPPVSGSTYNWTSAPAGFSSTIANPVVTPLVTTTYTVTETITATGCSNSHSVVVTVNPLPAATAGSDRGICLNASTQIGAASVPGNTYNWTSVPAGFVSTVANPTVSPLVTTTYTLIETITATGCTNTHQVVVTVNPLPAAVAGADRSICLNSSTQVGGVTVPGSTYSWTSVPSGFTSSVANPTVTPLVTTTYVVTETNATTGCTNTNRVVVSVNPLPAAVAGADRAICVNANTQIGAVAIPGNTYSWTSLPNGFTSTLANPTVSPVVTTTYTITETITATGCTNTHQVVVTVNPLPSAVAGADRAICLNATTQIGGVAIPGNTYNWTSVPVGFTSTLANPTVSPTVTTTYTVTESITVTGCTNTHNVLVTVNPLPAAIAGTDRAICLNGNSQIGAPAVPGSTYSWTSNPAGFTSTTSNPTVAPLVTTNYTVTETITATGCTNTHSVVVTVNPLPGAIAGTDRSVCLNSTTQIGAPAVSGSTYSWISIPSGFTSTTANPTVTPLVTTTYTVTEIITATGCTNTHSVVVTVNPLPAAVTGTDRAICLNGSTQIGTTAVSGSTFSWTSTPAGFTSTLSNPTVSPVVTTTYTLTETITATGCTNTHQVLVTVNPLPGAAAGSDRTICSNSATQIGAAAIPGSTYSWTSNPAGFFSSESNPTVSPLVTTTYTVVETITATGCSNSHQVVVNVNPIPAAATGVDRAICLNGSTQIGSTAVAGNSYSWISSPAGFTSTASNPTVSPVVTTTYTLTETIIATGCSNMHSVVVTVNPLPAATAGTDRAICLNTTTQIGASAVPGSTYNWTSAPAGFTSTEANPTVSPLVTTTYTVTEIITATGCTNTHHVLVTVNPLPAAIAGADRAICQNGSTQIGTASIPGSTYSWTSVPIGFTSTEASPTVSPMVTTTYTVVETIASTGCTNSHSVVVTVNPKPLLVITNPAPVCSPNRVDIGAGSVTAGSTLYNAALSYWLDAAATVPMNNPSAAGTGTYYIKATTLAGCYDIKPVTVVVNPLPTLYLGTGSGSYCAGGAGLVVGLSGSQLGVNYTLWNGCCTPLGITVAGTGGPITFSPPQTTAGYYSVHAENATTGCVNMMNNCILITIDPLLPVSVSIAASENPAPAGAVVTFTATPVNGGASPSYQWKVNGINVGTNMASYAYIPATGDEILCVLTSNASCTSGNPAVSNTVIMGIPAAITVTGAVVNGQTKCYSATQVLTVAGNGTTFIVQNGGSATMIAGQDIHYLPGTAVQPGGYMHGYITANNAYCGQSPSIVTVPTGEAEPVFNSDQTFFIIYPNPTTGNFTLEQKGEKVYGKVKVEIYGMRGDRLMTGEMIGEKKHQFWMSDLPSGLYFVKVVADGYVETFKLVKTR